MNQNTPNTTTAAEPTPARLAHANDNFTIDPATRAYHLTDTPVERLHAAGKLTIWQKQAAEKYFADYYAAGLAPLGAVDYGKAMVDGTSPSGHSDYRFSAVDRWRNAGKTLSAGTLKIIDRVVLREMSIELAGRDVSGRKDPGQARAVAMFVLVDGLDTLARHYGFTV